MKLLAVKVVDRVIVLEDQADFAEIAKHLVDVENVKADNFLYYAMGKFKPDKVSYNLEAIVENVELLFNIDGQNLKAYEYSLVFSLLLGFLSIPAILPDWKAFCQDSLSLERASDTSYPDDNLMLMWNQWEKISEFVYSEGKTVVKEIDEFDLDYARLVVSILHCKNEIPKLQFPGNWKPPSGVKPFVSRDAIWRDIKGNQPGGKRKFHAAAAAAAAGMQVSGGARAVSFFFKVYPNDCWICRSVVISFP